MKKNESEIYVYDYLDPKLGELRERVLKDFFCDKTKTDNMEFVDLGIYLKPETITSKISSVTNKSLLEDKIILSDSQIEILSILEEKNLFLSAPTSFGKTFIVLEYMIRHPNLNNIVFIVPTLALMNELLKKIYDSFGEKYNICVNGDEKIEEKNIFIFVPERSDNSFVKKISEFGLDLLIIDEIYKLKPKDKRELNNDDRIILMNKVYLNLLQIAKKIILLGPFIKQITFENTKLDIVKYYTNLSPVYNSVNNYCNQNWIDYIGGNKELVYFNSPESIYDSLELIIKRFPEDDEFVNKYKKEISHLEKTFFTDWYGIKLLKRGIGIHHGKTPMFLRKFYEEEYRNGSLKSLLCTSTLMEGVNTPTMRMIVVDDPGSIFKLNNLIGRVGRLNTTKPASGEIFLFNEKACEKYIDRNKWDKLTILSEDPNVTSDDEVLFLGKKNTDIDKENKYNQKINLILNETNKTLEEIKTYDIRINIAYKFAINEFKKKFLEAKDTRECIKLSCELLEKISYKFNKELFSNINYQGKTLPYLVFINMIISKKSFNDIILYFEKNYGNLSDKNKNLLIDKFLELRSFIKFKLSKIINYFELFNLNYNLNGVLKNFIFSLKDYNDLRITDKILEDLGIEETDFTKLNKFIPNTEQVSTSKIICYLNQNKKEIETMDLSPFTKRNIKRF